MKIIEYIDKYESDVKTLLKELQEYIVSIDSYHFNIINSDYEDKIFKRDMDEINNNDGKVYLAIEDNKAIGLIMGVIRKPEKDFDYERPNNMGEVIELIVTKNTRSKGIGRKLLKKQEEYFENQNCKTINIDVFGYNDIGKNFYFKNGYHTRMMTVSKKITCDNLKFEKGKIKLRRLKSLDSDYKYLEKWYQEEEIYYHFEQRKLTYEEIKNKYLPRTKTDAKIPVFMIEYDSVPIGIIQYQLINEENKKLYDLNIENCYEIDIFIGELNLHNKGIGKTSINLISNYLFKEKNAKALVMCPLKDNYNAINCYKNCGFTIRKEFETKDTIGVKQGYVLMTKEN